jgi:probable phosphoglycerate mutase
VLARHGRTEHTDRALLSGAGSDPPLSASGAAEARALAAAIAGLDGAGSALPGVGAVTRLVSSPQRRARETIALVAELAGLDAEVVVEEGWREISFGEWEGLSIAEVVERWPELSRRWFGATDVGPPGGESLDAFAARVRAQRERTVEANPGEVVLVVSHGGPVAAVVHEALEARAAALWRCARRPVLAHGRPVLVGRRHPAGDGQRRGAPRVGVGGRCLTSSDSPVGGLHGRCWCGLRG